MNKTLIAIATGALLVASQAHAGVSATVKVASDYTFNGVSQTDNDPALQASLDYAHDSGFYVGSWASNVNFDDVANVEWDFYVGNYWQLNDKIGLDAGVAYYTYHGESAASGYKYGEAYTKFNLNSALGNSELNLWYAWDYFGSDVGHYILMLAHTFEVSEGHHIKVTADRSISKNISKYSWDGKKGYNHYRAEYMTSWNQFDFNVAVEDTTMNWDTSDTRVVFSVSRSFDF